MNPTNEDLSYLAVGLLGSTFLLSVAVRCLLDQQGVSLLPELLCQAVLLTGTVEDRTWTGRDHPSTLGDTLMSAVVHC